MPEPMVLPDGLIERPLQFTDAAAVTSVMAAQELYDVGEVVIEEADIVADWQRPGYVVPEHAVGVFDGEDLVAYAEVTYADRGDAAVHPAHRGRGVGTALAGWMQERARELGGSVVGMPVPQGSAGDVLLEALGYRPRWESWVLELPEGATIPERPLPEGYTIGAAEEADLEGAWHVQEDAFLEWSVRGKDDFATWQSGTVKRPGFEPWNLRVVKGPSGDVVGVALIQMSDLNGKRSGFIARLATRKDLRGLGLGQALLVDAFAVAAEHGATRSELSTDSRTGALSLYEKVGMVTTSVWVNRAIDL